MTELIKTRICWTASTFNWLGQYSGSPRNSANCYAELAVSSLAVAATIASPHCVYPLWDGQAELAQVEYENGVPTKGHPSQY